MSNYGQDANFTEYYSDNRNNQASRDKPIYHNEDGFGQNYNRGGYRRPARVGGPGGSGSGSSGLGNNPRSGNNQVGFNTVNGLSRGGGRSGGANTGGANRGKPRKAQSQQNPHQVLVQPHPWCN